MRQTPLLLSLSSSYGLWLFLVVHRPWYGSHKDVMLRWICQPMSTVLADVMEDDTGYYHWAQIFLLKRELQSQATSIRCQSPKGPFYVTACPVMHLTEDSLLQHEVCHICHNEERYLDTLNGDGWVFRHIRPPNLLPC